MKERMKKISPAQRAEAHYWFEQAFQLGFLGRQFLHLKNIRKAIGYEGSDQSFSKLWILWLQTKLAEQTEEFRSQLDEFTKRVGAAIQDQENIKEGNDND